MLAGFLANMGKGVAWTTCLLVAILSVMFGIWHRQTGQPTLAEYAQSLRSEGSAIFSQAPDTVFKYVTNHDEFNQWFPLVKRAKEVEVGTKLEKGKKFLVYFHFALRKYYSTCYIISYIAT